jgi:sugar phosphate isomerase/epimerase
VQKMIRGMILLLLLNVPISVSANEFFAMDNATNDVKSIADKASLLKSYGYDGISWRPKKDLPSAISEMAKADLKIHAYMFVIDVSKKKHATTFPVDELKSLKGSKTILWVQLRSKGGDDKDAVRELIRLNAIAEPLGLKIAIYPHVNTHVDNLEDGLRIEKQVKLPNVGVSLTLCHQLKSKGVQGLKPLLKEALPKLFLVLISGAEKGDTKKMGWDKLIQPLGKGSYDIKGLLTNLKELKYTGPVGVIGYGIRQPAKEHLKQSMTFWQQPN